MPPLPPTTSAAASAASAAAAPTGGVQSATATTARDVDLSIWLTLVNWPALSLAVQNHWGGPQSAEKRDWFAGAVSDLLATTAPADLDVAYVEEFLLQVMQDEFEVVVDDDSAADVAEALLLRRQRVLGGDRAEVEQLLSAWTAKQRQRGDGNDRVHAQFVRGRPGEGDDAASDDDDEDDGDENEGDDGEEWDPGWEGQDVDVEMDEAPPLATNRDMQARRPPHTAPEVDEEGFTKVVGRRR